MNHRIKEIREYMKLSKITFSQKIGVDNSQYGKIEIGKLAPTIAQVMELCSKFNISSEWLLFGEGEMLKSQEPVHEAKDVKIVDNNYLFERLEYLAKANGILEERNKTLENELEQMKSHSSRNIGTSSYSIESEVKNVRR